MISVVMPCYLGDYPGAASNREEKLHRAIYSFITQGLGELIVVADGCEKTVQIVSEYSHLNVSCVWSEKQPLFSGELRNVGMKFAKYPIISYLDSDDFFGDGHLASIVAQFPADKDWVFWDDYLAGNKRTCHVSVCRIGTSCIAHKATTHAYWPSGYNHDWGFIQQLGGNFIKIENTRYNVQHVPGKIDE